MEIQMQRAKLEIGKIVSAFWALVKLVPTNTVANRKHIAERITALAVDVTAQRDRNALCAIEKLAQSRNRFERCYALDTIGRLGQFAVDTIPTLTEGLSSDDPFVREAAAQALFRMGRCASKAKRALIEATYNWPNEGTARYAVLALDEIGESSPDVLKALSFTVNSKTYAADVAQTVLARLHGEQQKAD